MLACVSNADETGRKFSQDCFVNLTEILYATISFLSLHLVVLWQLNSTRHALAKISSNQLATAR